MPLGLGSMETIYLSWATNAAPFKVCKSSIKKFLEKYRKNMLNYSYFQITY